MNLNRKGGGIKKKCGSGGGGDENILRGEKGKEWV